MNVAGRDGCLENITVEERTATLKSAEVEREKRTAVSLWKCLKNGWLSSFFTFVILDFATTACEVIRLNVLELDLIERYLKALCIAHLSIPDDDLDEDNSDFIFNEDTPVEERRRLVFEKLKIPFGPCHDFSQFSADGPDYDAIPAKRRKYKHFLLAVLYYFAVGVSTVFLKSRKWNLV